VASRAATFGCAACLARIAQPQLKLSVPTPVQPSRLCLIYGTTGNWELGKKPDSDKTTSRDLAGVGVAFLAIQVVNTSTTHLSDAVGFECSASKLL
jgi:hypothetical protein